MRKEGFLYRQKQKLNYHLAKNDFIRKVAEINRNELKIILDKRKESFIIEGNKLSFSPVQHAFILDRIDLFFKLLEIKEASFSLKENVLIYYIDGLKLRVTTAEELFIINEIFIGKCYNIIVPQNEFIVIDIGMNVGFASLFFANNQKVKKRYLKY